MSLKNIALMTADSGATTTNPQRPAMSKSFESTAPVEEVKLPPLRPRFPFWKELLLTCNAVVWMPMYSMALGMLVYTVMVYYAPTIWLHSLLLLYIPFIFWDPSPSNGKRPFGNRSACRSIKCYKWVADYFDMRLIKTCDLDPQLHYIMLYHPHGIIGVGTNGALNTNGCNFEQVFPGVRSYDTMYMTCDASVVKLNLLCDSNLQLERAGVTLNESFWAPFLREWMLRMGYISANKHTLREALEVQSIVLVPGGAAEALHARPGIMKLYLNNRRGFVRLALETKCPLVPCVGFGENEIFQATEAGPWQRQWSKVMRFSIPFLKHIVPQRAKVTVVVGEPLDFGDETNVDKCHALYLQHLRLLYNAEKAKYGYEHVELEII